MGVIWRRAAIVAFNLLLFWVAWSVFTPRRAAWERAATWDGGEATSRAAVVAQLRAFQDGYSRRNGADVAGFVGRVFSRDHPVVLGTMPGEVFVGTDQVTKLVRTDWESWGDCRFQVDASHVATAGDTAWFATVGTVKFDLSRFLVLPLRLTGVMVREADGWRIRQAQFQFDVDLSWLLLLDLLLLAWLAVNLSWLVAAVYRYPARKATATR